MGEAPDKGERRYDIDWLRVLAVLLLVPYHTAVIFDRGHVSYIKDRPDAVLVAFAYFLNQWHMPLFFLVSGAATWFSLGSRTGSQYIRERIKRLVVPLVFGTLVIVPIQVYFQRLYYHEFSGSYMQFYPHFFDGIYPRGNLTWGQLWFLAYLFVFSSIALPLFLFLRIETGQRFLSRVASFCARPGAIFLLALPLALIEAVFRARWPGFQNLYNDWANFFFYLVIFIYGYLLCSETRLSQAIEKHAGISLGMGFASIAVILLLRSTGYAPARSYSLEWTLYMVFRGFNSWFWIVAILGFGHRYLNTTNRTLEYATEGALPFYILHHAVIVVIGYYVVRWNASAMERFLAITITALLATVIAYDVLVRRTKFTRLLFGMKLKKPTTSSPVG